MFVSETYHSNFSGLRSILKDRVLVFRGLVWREFDLDVIHLPFCFSMDPAQMSRNDYATCTPFTCPHHWTHFNTSAQCAWLSCPDWQISWTIVWKFGS